ncbi:hypothetical protein RND71_020079 [Anisodus tanguticus]|uniref:Uncharacterized protein n=1 Tax=Anisodus tanguticus TaxID=243964 RepID=A0AAE1S1R0_9SOLA|nr:hypothetical protein RND71_020079 [Anisodus tanguticus]
MLIAEKVILITLQMSVLDQTLATSSLDRTMKIWDAAKSNRTWPHRAHDGIISSLADSPQHEIVASVSHDQLIKIWE